MEILKKYYYDPKFGYTSKEIFKKKIKEIHPEISSKEIDEFYKNQMINQIMKKPVVKKENYYKITDVPLSFQIDIMIFNKSQKLKNRGYFMYLTLIDILSRKAFMYGIKSRKGEDIIEAYNQFLDDLKTKYDKKPVKLIGDDEFNFKAFNELNNKLNIIIDTQTAQDDHFTAGDRLGIIDRYTKTIKGKVLKYQLSTGNINFHDVLDDILDNYNNTYHSGINNNTPNEVFDDNKLQLENRKEALEYNKNIYKRIKLDIGTKVRAIKKKNIFDKEKPSFSKKIYEIDDIKGLKYIIKDDEGNIKKKLYKAHELQPVDEKNIDKYNQNEANKEIKQLKKELKVKQTLKKDNINEDNIINEVRIKKKPLKYN
jgi:uncharacterized membrane protein (UPF0127 family)